MYICKGQRRVRRGGNIHMNVAEGGRQGIVLRFGASKSRGSSVRQTITGALTGI